MQADDKSDDRTRVHETCPPGESVGCATTVGLADVKLATIAYKNWDAITYAKKYCGLASNVCGVFLNSDNKTDCAHFMAHCLDAGGIKIKTSDPNANFCPRGLAVRNTDLLTALKDLDKRYSNVTQISIVDAIVGDVGFLNNLTRPSHVFMLCGPVDIGDLTKPAKVWAHTTNRCEADMAAEIRQWFATMFRITDAS